MTPSAVVQVGASVTLTKEISEADLALFALVLDDHVPATEEPPSTEPEGRSAIPGALVAALLAATAARHGGGLERVTLRRSEVSSIGLAFTGDTLTAAAEVAAYDTASRTLRIRAHCANQEGTRLAEGTFELQPAEGVG
jgi:3-hydroxybutyryl-CoA dehydratase